MISGLTEINSLRDEGGCKFQRGHIVERLTC